MELTTTLPVNAETAHAIEALVKQFPEGKRIRVVVTDEPPLTLSYGPSAPNSTLADFLGRLDDARRLLPPSPWQSTEEAMNDLREGERD